MSRLPPLVSRLIPSLARNNDNEVLTTARAIGSALRTAGLDFHDLARAVENSGVPRSTSPMPKPPSEMKSGGVGFSWIARHQAKHARTDYDRATWLAKHALLHLNDREQQFICDLERRLSRYGNYATFKQATWLDAIFQRVVRCAA